jgi:hypothetical protein
MRVAVENFNFTKIGNCNSKKRWYKR